MGPAFHFHERRTERSLSCVMQGFQLLHNFTWKRKGVGRGSRGRWQVWKMGEHGLLSIAPHSWGRGAGGPLPRTWVPACWCPGGGRAPPALRRSGPRRVCGAPSPHRGGAARRPRGAGHHQGAACVGVSWVSRARGARSVCRAWERAVFLPEAAHLDPPLLLSTCRPPGSARRFRWHARVPVSRSAAEGPLRKAGGHVGLR